MTPEEAEDRVRAAHRLIDEAIETYNPVAAVALCSGGTDSTASTAVSMLHPFVKLVGFSDTGTGPIEVVHHMESLCAGQGWPLMTVQPELDRVEGRRGAHYEHLSQTYGMMGTPLHIIYFSELKQKPWRIIRAHLQKKRGDKILWISGARTNESKRRMTTVTAPIQVIDSHPWVAPIWDWSKLDCREYATLRGLPSSPVADRLHMSGECLCGANGSQQELAEVAFWYPETAAWLRSCEAIAKQAGLPCTWGPKGKGKASPRATAQARLIDDDARRMQEIACGKCPVRP